VRRPHLRLALALTAALLAPLAAAAEARPADAPVDLRTAGEPLVLGVADAILLCLENNSGLAVQRLGPTLKRTSVAEARSAFDPALSASVGRTDATDQTGDSVSESQAISISELLPTGTQLKLGVTRSLARPGMTSDTDTAGLSLGVTQPFLRGGGRAVGLAAIRQARLDLAASEHELRGYAQSLVAQVIGAYWDLALATKQLGIYEESLRLAEEQLRQTEERIRLGGTAPVEAAAARAEVASRKEALISARGGVSTARLKLLRLVNPPGAPEADWEREVVLRDEPAVPPGGLDDVRDHVARALRDRPDLEAARRGLERGELELVKTRNGLLPRLDVFVTLGRTGYSDSFAGAFGDLGEGSALTLGLSFEQAIGNRAARSRHARARVTQEQSHLALANLEQLVQVDVRTAHLAARVALEQIAATAASRALKEETLRGEEEKFRVGRSTSFQVAQAARDYTASRVAEVAAVVGYLKALAELHRLDGSLLDRVGVRSLDGPQASAEGR